MSCTLLMVPRVTFFGGKKQFVKDKTFIGGKPRIPIDVELPICQLCGEQLTFFLQIGFPEEHVWRGRTLAVFSCTATWDTEHTVSPLAREDWRKPCLTSKDLKNSQQDHRFIIFRTDQGVLREDYEEKIRYCSLKYKRIADMGHPGTKIGGYPHWLGDAVKLAKLDGKWPMQFLGQIAVDSYFPLVPTAPSRAFEFRKLPVTEKFRRSYSLFYDNQCYFFGSVGRDEPIVYCIIQH